MTFAEVVATTIANIRNEQLAQIQALEKRIAALEAKPAVEYKGSFQHGTAYAAGSLCSRSGSLWLALRENSVAPGVDPTAWRLVVKEGRAQ